MLALLARSLGREDDARYDALYAWKHEDNPFGPSPAWVAVDGDRLAGLRVLMRWEFVEAGRVLRAVRAVDTATHPDYQGRGIFTRLTLPRARRAAARRVDFVFNTPNDQSRPGLPEDGLAGRRTAADRGAADRADRDPAHRHRPGAGRAVVRAERRRRGGRRLLADAAPSPGCSSRSRIRRHCGRA